MNSVKKQTNKHIYIFFAILNIERKQINVALQFIRKKKKKKSYTHYYIGSSKEEKSK
jgi:hypothetical protein